MAAVVIVFQSLVELFGMAAYLWIVPRCRVALNCEMGNPTKSTAELCP